MKTAYYYFFVEPLIDKYEDNDTILPKFSIKVYTESKTYVVSLYANEKQIYMLRITVPDLEKDQITEEDAKIVQSLKEHMLSILRINYDGEISLFPKNIHSFAEDGKPYNFGVNLESFSVKPMKFDKIRSAFMGTLNIRTQLKLLSDSQNPNIPRQCQLISLYKLLELEFKEKGKWKDKEFDNFIMRFEDDFNKLNLSNRELKNYIHEIRDRCAHIKSNKDVLYYIELNGKNVKEVESFLNFLINMCTILIDEKYGDETLKIGCIPKE
ncbi:hypothetical protein [uncultured Methanobacterium sp.]|uniref:hypothetical protein n=1 Tax=uncultured Methanobacterium sp. TaxID=176306 RepID=UPI002AA6E437|nr:hypothetical protein [uncultured Methanobacterium sp.]